MDRKLVIKLSAFQQSRIIESENETTGEIEKGIFIPFKWNDIHIGYKGNVNVSVGMFDREHDYQYNQTHSLIPLWSHTFRKQMELLGIRPNFVGFATTFKNKFKRIKANDIIDDDPIDEAL
jgi:hypothetical protein